MISQYSTDPAEITEGLPCYPGYFPPAVQKDRGDIPLSKFYPAASNIFSKNTIGWLTQTCDTAHASLPSSMIGMPDIGDDIRANGPQTQKPRSEFSYFSPPGILNDIQFQRLFQIIHKAIIVPQIRIFKTLFHWSFKHP